MGSDKEHADAELDMDGKPKMPKVMGGNVHTRTNGTNGTGSEYPQVGAGSRRRRMRKSKGKSLRRKKMTMKQRQQQQRQQQQRQQRRRR